jgi:hypothetical protein
MKKIYRISFVHSDSKNKLYLGITLGKYKVEGIGWTRAFQLVQRDSFGNLPLGRIEFEEMRK